MTATNTGPSESSEGTVSDSPSLNDLFNAEVAASGPPTRIASGEEAEEIAAPHTGRAPSPASPDVFATPASSDSPEDPEDVEHDEEADDVDLALPEVDPEDKGVGDGDEETSEDDINGRTSFLETGCGDEAAGEDADDAPAVKAPEEIAFADLGLPADLLKAVTDMGYETPTAIQREAIPVLLAGQDVVGVAQTGTGKTAAFGLPLLNAVEADEHDVQALVLAPTRELALQSADAVTDMAHRSRGLDVVAVYGGAPYGPQIGALREGAQVVVGTPGRVIDLIDKGALILDDVKYFVLDEADEMLRMGFAEDVETIAASLPGRRRTALFSATMPPAIQAVARQHLHEPVQIEVSRQASTVDTVH